jgi:hypothetical protein
VQFLRTFYPDIDIPSELTREEVKEDAQEGHFLEEFDPYASNTLAMIHGSRRHPFYLGFPMGETRRSLSTASVTRNPRILANKITQL